MRARFSRVLLVAGLIAATLSITGPQAGANHVIYVADKGAVDDIFAVDPTTGTRTLVTSGGNLESVEDVFAVNGMLFVADDDGPPATGNGVILSVDPLTGTQTVVTVTDALFNSPESVFFHNGQLFVAHDAGSGTSGAFQIDPPTGTITQVRTGPPFDDSEDAVVGPDGGLYLADSGADAVFRVDLNTANVTTVSAGGSFASPEGIAFSPSGQMYVVDQAAGTGGSVFHVDMTTGAQTVVSTGQNFVDPQGIDVASDGTIYVVDDDALGGTGALFRINPANGQQTVVASGAPFDDPVGVSVHRTAGGTTPPPPGATNTPPAFSAPNCGSTVLIPVFGNVTAAGTVNVAASDANAGQTVTLTAAGLPTYATLTSAPGNPATGQISANPTILDWLVGLISPASTATITATDSGTPARTATCAVTMRVNLVQGSPI